MSYRFENIFSYLKIEDKKNLEIFLIFKFILIYLLHVLFVLKIGGIFEKKQPTKKS